MRRADENKFVLSAEVKACIPAIISIIALFVLGENLSPGFASVGNISNVLTQTGLLLIISIGQAMVFFTGNADFSVGAYVSMGAVIGAEFMNGQNNLIPLGALTAIVFGGGFGLISGLGVQKLRVPSLAMTLAMSSVINGFTIWYTNGVPQAKVPSMLGRLGRSLVGELRPLMIIALIAIVGMELIMHKTRFGKSVYMVGSNRNAAELCGINVSVIVVVTFMISGAVSAIGGFLLFGYVGFGQIGMGDSYTLMSVASVVIGGVSLYGGRGSFIGVALGSIVYLLMTSVLVSLGLPAGVRIFFQGLILAMILLVNCRSEKLRK
jgi:ribose transport system permease protein